MLNIFQWFFGVSQKIRHSVAAWFAYLADAKCVVVMDASVYMFNEQIYRF